MTRTIRSVLLSASIALLTIVGCVSNPPVSPDITKENYPSAESGHILLGFYSVKIDLDGMTAEIVPVRETLDHFNVTKYLVPPYCPDCLKIHVMGIDWVNLNVTAEVTVKNFTKGLTGYDVRGIVYTSSDFKLLNPYAYTELYLPLGVVDPCGFRAYETSDPDRKIGPGESSTETFIIGFPSGAKFVNLKYAIDASAPGHCLEPYEITGFDQEYLDPSVGATAQVSVYVSDWQDDTTSVNIDLEILGGVNKKMDHGAGDLWTVEITNVYGLPTGMYPALITAADKVGWFNLYQWVEIEIGSVIDDDPPIWDNETGITGAYPGLTGIVAKFGTATDPSEPVTYNLYWAVGPTIDFATANEITGIEQSPYFLEDLDPDEYTLAVRASDSLDNETTNENSLTVETGIHPNVYWINGPDMPQARSRGGCFYANGKFWVIGGKDSMQVLDTVSFYDPAYNIWITPAWTLPEPRYAFGCGVYSGSVYLFGGMLSFNEYTDTCEIIELSTGLPQPNPPVLPMALAGMGCTKLDNIFYLAGGVTFDGMDYVYHREAYALTPPSTDFVGETDLEYETAWMGFASGVDYLMTCGGYPDRKDVLYHKPGAKSWEFKSELPSQVIDNAAVIVDGWLYSMGGGSWPPTAEVNVMDVAGNIWYSLNPMTVARGAPMIATDGEFIYSAGGFKSVGPADVSLSAFEIGKIF